MEYLDNDGLEGRMGNSGGRQFYQRIIGGLYPVLDPLLQLLQKIVDKGLDLHRLEATGGVKGIELDGWQHAVCQHPAQPSLFHQRLGDEGRHVDDSAAGCGRLPGEGDVVHRNRMGYRNVHAGFDKLPLAALVDQGLDAAMTAQILRPLRLAELRQIGGTGEQLSRTEQQRPRHQAGILGPPQLDGDIHALLHRVDMATGKLHIHLQVGIAAHELANHGTEQQLAEFDGRGNPQQSGGLALQLHDRRSEEHTSELQSRPQLVCRLLLENTTVASYISTLSLHDALPIWRYPRPPPPGRYGDW